MFKNGVSQLTFPGGARLRAQGDKLFLTVKAALATIEII